MNAIQKNQQTMGNATANTCDTFHDLYLALPKVEGSVQKHKTNLLTIAGLEQKQEDALNLRALIHDKNLLRVLITAETIRIISGIKALADDTSDTQLEGKVNYPPSTLEKMTDSLFLATCTKIKEIADANAGALVDFGISTEILSGYALDLTAFDSIYKKPQSVRGQLKMYTSNLALSVKAMMKHLKKSLDNLIKSNFPATDFETAYFNSRKVYKVAVSTELIGNIKDGNNHPVKDAIIEMIDYPSPGTITVRSTNAKGHYAFKRLTATRCQIRIRAIGFTTAFYEIDLIKDGVKSFNITLIPDPAPVPVNA
jgi:hypothetical protein